MRKVLLLLTLIVLSASGSVSADTNPKREMRAAWLATVYNIDWPSSKTLSAANMKTELTGILDKLQAANFNAVCLQVRPMGDAFYNSTLEPTSAYVAGTRGATLSWDPVAYFVSECHKRNMEAHAWINPYRLPYTLSTSLAFDKKVTNNGWSLTFKNSSGTNLRVLNPGIAAVRKHITSVIKELVTKYDIDGVLFDDYFYPEGMPLGSGYDYTQYSSYVTTTEAAGKTPMSQADWRRNNVNKTVKMVSDTIKSVKPYVRFGIGPAGVAGKNAAAYGLPACYAGNDWVYDGIYCDALAWLKAGSIDYISPQIYWARTHSTNPYEPIAKWWSEVAVHFGRHFFASQSTSSMSATEIAAQIDINRQQTLTSEPGSIFYNTTNTLSDLASIKTKFKYPAAVPEMTWYKNTSAPGTIKSLGMASGSLTATSVFGARYIFYAIPEGTDRIAAASTDHAGLKPKYILGITYSNKIAVPADRQTGYWYAAALLDRYGKEWELTTLNEPASEPAPAPELFYPDNGFRFEGDDVLLALTPNGSTTYTVQVSASSSFTKIAYSTSSHMVDTEGKYQFLFPANRLGGAGTYYWRVLVTKTGYLSSYSEVRHFEIPDRETGSDYTVITDGNEYDYMESGTDGTKLRLTSAWIRSDIHGNKPAFNLGSTGTDNNHRDIAVSVRDGAVYMLEATVGNKTTPVYLRRYSAATGARLADLRLSFADDFLNACYSPVNTVMADSKGNILVSGLKLANSGSLVLGRVDMETGAVTTVATLGNVTERVDHTGAYGDIDGTLYVFAVGSSGSTVHRWKVQGGTVTHASFSLTDAMGLAPRVFPVSSTVFFLDSHNCGFESFKWGTAIPQGRFSSAATSLAPTSKVDGGVYFTYEGVPMICYASKCATADGAARYTLASGANLPSSYSGLKSLWEFPSNAGGLGTQLPANDWGTPVAYLPPSDVTASATVSAPGYIIVHSPLNGIAGYKIDKVVASGVILPQEDIAAGITVGTDRITLPVTASEITIYNIVGIPVATVRDSAEISRPAGTGVFILVARTESGVIRSKINLQE